MTAEQARPTRVVLIRHAVTSHTGSKLSGRMVGIDLTDRGREQATATAARLATGHLDVIYASPIERTMQTAAIVAEPHGLQVQVCDGVIEAEYGEWTDQTLAELAKTPEWQVVQGSPSQARFPGGESIREMQARTVAAIDDLVARHPGQTVAVVSHADPIKSAIAHYTGVHLDLFQRINVSPASVTVFEFHRIGVMMHTCNETGDVAGFLPAPPGEAD